MNALVDTHDDAAAQLSELAAAWTQVGRAYYAADCLERVLLDRSRPITRANEALETVLSQHRRVAGADRPARPPRGAASRSDKRARRAATARSR